MKELSIEQKAKAYDELLIKAKQIYNKENDVLIIHTIEDLFPELKESEGERIRKELLNYLHDVHDDDEERARWIAWLEKQGEQKPVTDFSDIRTWKYIVDAVWTEKEGIGQYLDSPFTEEVAKKLQKRFGNIEQKPAWSEEDEKQARQIQRIVHDDGCTQKLQEQIVDWLKALKGRYLPQPKQEWSQKDIDMINWLIRCCEKEHEELCNDKYGHQDIVSDLKRDCRKKWDWLESLKNKVAPHNTWKPSDEQIRICKEVYADILSAKGFDIGTVNSELNRLEEQLKKLREE